MFIHSIFGEGHSCNSFLLVDKKSSKAIVIDPGLNGQKILSFLEENKIEVENILLTHGHFDHIEEVPLILEKFPQAKVYLHELEKEFLLDSKLNCSAFVHFSHKVEINIDPVLISKGEKIKFGHHIIKIKHTPFHTRGSVSYYIEDINALFGGDTLFKGAIGRSDLPTGDPSLVYKSLSKIRALPPETIVYPGHGPLTTIEDEAKNNVFLLSKVGI